MKRTTDQQKSKIPALKQSPTIAQEPTMSASKKRPAEDSDDDEPTEQKLPSPSHAAPTSTPKRLRLSSTQPASTPAHRDLTSTLTKTPLTPQATPSKPKATVTAKAAPKKLSRKQQIATDPINTSIYDLRKEGRAWDDIATRTNAACALDESEELTPSACYSRFFRNGPLVAKEKGEEWRREAYLHMKGPVGKVDADGGVEEKDGDEGQESKVREAAGERKGLEKSVVKAVEVVKAGFWASVAEVVNVSLDEGKKLTEEQVKAVFDQAGGEEE